MIHFYIMNVAYQMSYWSYLSYCLVSIVSSTYVIHWNCTVHHSWNFTLQIFQSLLDIQTFFISVCLFLERSRTVYCLWDMKYTVISLPKFPFLTHVFSATMVHYCLRIQDYRPWVLLINLKRDEIVYFVGWYRNKKYRKLLFRMRNYFFIFFKYIMIVWTCSFKSFPTSQKKHIGNDKNLIGNGCYTLKNFAPKCTHW